MPKPTTIRTPRRTPTQIAQDDLDKAVQLLADAVIRKTRHEAKVEQAVADIAALRARCDWLSDHPALKDAVVRDTPEV